MSALAMAKVLGDDMDRHPPVRVDDVACDWTARPADEERLAQTLALASEHGLVLIPFAGGTHAMLGNPPSRADVRLDLGALRGVLELDRSEGVCHVRGATPLSALREALVGTGWEVPLDVPDASTVGGALACNAVGPRTQGQGLVRDVVLGLSIAHASGKRTRCGGRVVKNVTGYDLAKLYVGSLGTLGIMTSAWLRLRPVPRCLRTLELAVTASPAAAAAAGVEIARRAGVRACALVGADGAFRVRVELAGDEASVEETAAALGADHDAREAAAGAIDALRGEQNDPRRLRFRLGALPQALGPALEVLAEAGAETLTYPGLGLIHAVFPGERATGDTLWRVMERAGGGRDCICEAAPAAFKRENDVFGSAGSALGLIQALKQRFDPQAVLNRGRFAGRV